LIAGLAIGSAGVAFAQSSGTDYCAQGFLNADANADVMTREEAANRSAQRFMMMDRNRDGRIDAQEWAQQETLNDDLEDIINIQFGEADAYASGGLTQEEMRAAAQRPSEGSDAGAPVLCFVFPHSM
jgi:hypothetical protein